MKKFGVLVIAGVLATLLTACERDDRRPQVYNDNTTTQPANGVQPTVTPPADTTTTPDTHTTQ